MGSSQLLAAILLLLGVTLTVSADPKEEASMPRAFQISCKNCNTLQFGDPSASSGSERAIMEHTCPAKTLCGPVSGAYSCIPEDSPNVASCSCEGKETTYIPEPYDLNKYIVCLPGGGQSVLECKPGEIFTGDTAKPCATGPSCESAKQGFNALTPDCKKYFFCETGGSEDSGDSEDGDETEVQPAERSSILREGEEESEEGDAAPVPTYVCPDDKVFDVATLVCVDPCSLAPEPFTCEPAASGSFPDPSDCQLFHLCFGGNKIGDPIPCPPEKYFNKESGACDAEDDTNCPKDGNECYTHYKAQCSACADS